MSAICIISRSIAGRSLHRSLCTGKIQEKAPESKAKAEVDGFKPMYATKANFDAIQQEMRKKSAGIEHGQIPTYWQKKFLVLTKLYKREDDIPEYVQNGTMNRMHDRLRVMFIIVGILVFFILFFVGERINVARIDRDRNAGKVVTKM